MLDGRNMLENVFVKDKQQMKEIKRKHVKIALGSVVWMVSGMKYLYLDNLICE